MDIPAAPSVVTEHFDGRQPAVVVDSRPVPVVKLKVVSGRGKIKVDIDPNLPKKQSWKFRVQKLQSDGVTWKTWRTYRTSGKKELRTINPRKGTFRVVVVEQNFHQSVISTPVTLRK